MRSVLEVIAFAMIVSLVDIVFLAFDSYCLMRYGATRFLEGGGSHRSGGLEGVVMSSLYCLGMWHITRLDGSSLFVCVT